MVLTILAELGASRCRQGRLGLHGCQGGLGFQERPRGLGCQGHLEWRECQAAWGAGREVQGA
jgi:hypothetical protein